MKEKPTYYAVIPANVRYDKDLKANEKLLYGEISALSQKNGKCWASNGYFAELYNVSLKSISRWINNLKQKKYIDSVVVYRENSKEVLNRYLSICPEGIDNNVHRGIDNNVQDNNTSNNNTSIIEKKENFKKPSLVEIAEYCLKRNNGIDPESFYAFYETRGWMVGRVKMKNWKMCIITWEKNTKKEKGENKMHKHISSHIQAKQLLKQSRQ